MQKGREWHWLLSLVRMRRTDKQLQLVQHVPRESVLRQHPLDGQFQNLGRLFGPQLNRPNMSLTTGPAGVPSVILLSHLLGKVFIRIVFDWATREPNLVCVDHDHVIARINVRCVLGPVFAHQYRRDLGREMSDHQTTAVNDEPAWFALATLNPVGGLHKSRLRSDHVVSLPSKLAFIASSRQFATSCNAENRMIPLTEIRSALRLRSEKVTTAIGAFNSGRKKTWTSGR